MQKTQLTDTIVALATAPGVGAIAVLRISGALTFEILEKIFSAANKLNKKIKNATSHTAHFGSIIHNGMLIDEVLVTIFKNPKSYTGEDVAEISCHGSTFIQQQIVNAVIACGARLATPGEYTQRAFINGKLDLTQAEAVADIIASDTAAAAQAALHNIRGGFKKVLQNLRDELIQFSALIELELDFAEEDVAFADRQKLNNLIQTLTTTTTQLLQSFALGNVIKNGITIAIVGKPNAGKSTLLNALLNEDRAIVSPIAGTTRDTIEATLIINGIQYRLIDTAGLRDTTTDVIEQIGIQKSKETIQQAELVLYLYDASNTTNGELETIIAELRAANKKYILLANKTDLPSIATNEAHQNALKLIATKNTGIEEIKIALQNYVQYNPLQHEGVIITNTRHYNSLLQIQESLLRITQALVNHTPTDLVAQDIRHCLTYIGELTGEVSNEHVLDYIFSKFCIGK